MTNYVSYTSFDPCHQKFIANLAHIKDPVISFLNQSQILINWVTETNKELHVMELNNTWKLVQSPKGKTIVGCKWGSIYKIKYLANGEIERYKARLVAS